MKKKKETKKNYLTCTKQAWSRSTVILPETFFYNYDLKTC